MGLETHVTVKVECDDWYPLEDMLSIIRGEQPFAAEIEPYFFIPTEEKKDLYTGNGAVRRSSYQKKNGKTMYVMELHGEAHHLSVVNWFIIPVGELEKAYKENREWEGNEGFFIKAIPIGKEFRITCESHGVENLDNHKISLKYTPKGKMENRVKLVVDGKEVKDNGFYVDFNEK